MQIIECALDCKFQKDGYCELQTVATVNSLVKKECPHYKKAKKSASDKR